MDNIVLSPPLPSPPVLTPLLPTPSSETEVICGNREKQYHWMKGQLQVASFDFAPGPRPVLLISSSFIYLMGICICQRTSRLPPESKHGRGTHFFTSSIMTKSKDHPVSQSVSQCASSCHVGSVAVVVGENKEDDWFTRSKWH